MSSRGRPPSDEEKGLQSAQAEALKEQNSLLKENMRVQNLLAPMLYEQVGLSPQFDASGKIVGFGKIQSEEEDLRKETSILALRRQKAALAGELPLDPGLMKDLGDRQKTLEEELSKDFGSLSAARTSSGGIERLTAFEGFKERALDASRRGDLSLASQLAAQQDQMNFQRNVSSPATIASLPFSQANSFGTLANAYGNAANPLVQSRISNDARASSQQTSAASAATSLGMMYYLSTLGTAACWVAEALYGVDAIETHTVRAWVFKHRNDKNARGVFCRLYGKFGRRWAQWVRRSTIVRFIAKAIWSRLYRTAKRER